MQGVVVRTETEMFLTSQNKSLRPEWPVYSLTVEDLRSASDDHQRFVQRPSQPPRHGSETWTLSFPVHLVFKLGSRVLSGVWRGRGPSSFHRWLLAPWWRTVTEDGPAETSWTFPSPLLEENVSLKLEVGLQSWLWVHFLAEKVRPAHPSLDLSANVCCSVAVGFQLPSPWPVSDGLVPLGAPGRQQVWNMAALEGERFLVASCLIFKYLPVYLHLCFLRPCWRQNIWWFSDHAPISQQFQICCSPLNNLDFSVT